MAASVWRAQQLFCFHPVTLTNTTNTRLESDIIPTYRLIFSSFKCRKYKQISLTFVRGMLWCCRVAFGGKTWRATAITWLKSFNISWPCCLFFTHKLSEDSGWGRGARLTGGCCWPLQKQPLPVLKPLYLQHAVSVFTEEATLYYYGWYWLYTLPLIVSGVFNFAASLLFRLLWECL